MTGKIADLFNLRRGETAPVFVAGLFFFCILTALMMLRPAGHDDVHPVGNLDARQVVCVPKYRDTHDARRILDG